MNDTETQAKPKHPGGPGRKKLPAHKKKHRVLYYTLPHLKEFVLCMGGSEYVDQLLEREYTRHAAQM